MNDVTVCIGVCFAKQVSGHFGFGQSQIKIYYLLIIDLGNVSAAFFNSLMIQFD